MKVFIISYYRWWNIRQKYFYEYYINNGYDVKFITSDYDHIKKEYSFENNIPKNSIKVHVPKYTNNLSFKRIISNYVFYKEVKKILYKNCPDIIICLIPSNFLGKALYKYNKYKNDAKIITDIIDLWPESMPINKLSKALLFFPFYIWKRYRNFAFKSSNLVLFECDYFRKIINYKKNNYKILYLQKMNSNVERLEKVQSIKKISFIYLGSINDIIDINLMIKLLDKISKKIEVELKIIGKGKKENYFVNVAKSKGINTIFYGPIFDDKIKNDIVSSCHFGLNLYKNGLAIGLTTKSMDYLSNSVPIINNIKEDTFYLIEKYNAGLNLNDIDEVAEIITNLTLNDYKKMCAGAYDLYDKEFSENVFKKKLFKILDEFS